MSTRIYRGCDRCESKGIDTPGIPRGPFDGRMIDLCDACHVEVVGPLVALLDDRGVPVDGAKAKRGPYRPKKAPVAAEPTVPVPVGPVDRNAPFTCPLCGAVGIVKDSWVMHLRTVHGIPTTVELWGNRCPVCGQEFNGIGQHVARAHADLGLRRVVDAFEWARVNGDPCGVYAAQIAPRLAS